MGKLIFLVLAVAFAWWVLKSYRKSITRRGPPRAAAPEDMVRCAHCGVHLPINDAVVDRGNAYCSEAHRLAGPSDHAGS